MAQPPSRLWTVQTQNGPIKYETTELYGIRGIEECRGRFSPKSISSFDGGGLPDMVDEMNVCGVLEDEGCSSSSPSRRKTVGKNCMLGWMLAVTAVIILGLAIALFVQGYPPTVHYLSA